MDCPHGVAQRVVGRVTLQTDAVRRRTKLGAVRFMTIAAGDTGCEHPALFERAIIVDLIDHLPVGGIEAMRERRDRMGVGQPVARDPLLGESTTARVAWATGLDLLA